MKNNNSKKETLRLVDVMIDHADKGPSGFWTEDYEGCGNPLIFPEFDEGLKHGRLVQKDHYYCPWNTAILYGDGHGSISTGCYHSCSIKDAKYLSESMLKDVLFRFKKKLQNGDYDDVSHIEPLLTENEVQYINQQKILEKQDRENQRKKEYRERKRKASNLLAKFDDEETRGMIVAHYGSNTILMCENGPIDFNPKEATKIANAEDLSYDDYLEITIKTGNNVRHGFSNVYYNISLGFKGQIEKKDSKHVCFKRIFIEGMFDDGVCFDDKEDHVWMDINGFEEFEVGDNLSFFAEVYKYLKHNKGKAIDYGLRNPEDIKKIDAYELPTDDELALQQINMIICESCYLNEQCNRAFCMRNPKELKLIRKQMLAAIKHEEDGGKNEEDK